MVHTLLCPKEKKKRRLSVDTLDTLCLTVDTLSTLNTQHSTLPTFSTSSVGTLNEISVLN
ncbi:hypothetical protein RchiOBHm_Chr0c36g0502951 [Rosa chinensis]|uniref:Uncharacterized protein n=1 Tax=Rosa chinensis TaxID=74649 RepID=A0A2P6RUC2_ROSCH|nr:hypothetical protein RchiOBHm_Chr2g0128601 [Rosa chinensis]PRQ60838.1 hypothetical protein RchiOBHm_Chr0c36g0502951 [Rosa chinensis]